MTAIVETAAVVAVAGTATCSLGLASYSAARQSDPLCKLIKDAVTNAKGGPLANSPVDSVRGDSALKADIVRLQYDNTDAGPVSVAFNGEVLQIIKNQQPQPAVALGGANVEVKDGKKVIAKFKEQVSSVTLEFSDENEANKWFKEMSQSAERGAQHERIQKLIDHVLKLEKHITDLSTRAQKVQTLEGERADLVRKLQKSENEMAQEKKGHEKDGHDKTPEGHHAEAFLGSEESQMRDDAKRLEDLADMAVALEGKLTQLEPAVLAQPQARSQDGELEGKLQESLKIIEESHQKVADLERRVVDLESEESYAVELEQRVAVLESSDSLDVAAEKLEKRLCVLEQRTPKISQDAVENGAVPKALGSSEVGRKAEVARGLQIAAESCVESPKGSEDALRQGKIQDSLREAASGMTQTAAGSYQVDPMVTRRLKEQQQDAAQKLKESEEVFVKALGMLSQIADQQKAAPCASSASPRGDEDLVAKLRDAEEHRAKLEALAASLVDRVDAVDQALANIPADAQSAASGSPVPAAPRDVVTPTGLAVTPTSFAPPSDLAQKQIAQLKDEAEENNARYSAAQAEVEAAQNEIRKNEKQIKQMQEELEQVQSKSAQFEKSALEMQEKSAQFEKSALEMQEAYVTSTKREQEQSDMLVQKEAQVQEAQAQAQMYAAQLQANVPQTQPLDLVPQETGLDSQAAQQLQEYEQRLREKDQMLQQMQNEQQAVLQQEKDRLVNDLQAQMQQQLDSQREQIKNGMQSDMQQQMQQQLDLQREQIQNGMQSDMQQQLDSQREQIANEIQADMQQQMQQQLDSQREQIANEIQADMQQQMQEQLDLQREQIQADMEQQVQERVQQQLNQQRSPVKEETQVDVDMLVQERLQQELDQQREQMQQQLDQLMDQQRVDLEQQKQQELDQQQADLQQQLDKILQEKLDEERDRSKEEWEQIVQEEVTKERDANQQQMEQILQDELAKERDQVAGQLQQASQTIADLEEALAAKDAMSPSQDPRVMRYKQDAEDAKIRAEEAAKMIDTLRIEKGSLQDQASLYQDANLRCKTQEQTINELQASLSNATAELDRATRALASAPTDDALQVFQQQMQQQMEQMERSAKDKEAMMTKEFEDEYAKVRRQQQDETKRADAEAANARLLQQEKAALLQQMDTVQQQLQEAAGMYELEQRARLAEDQLVTARAELQRCHRISEEDKNAIELLQSAMRKDAGQGDALLAAQAKAEDLQQQVFQLSKDKDQLMANEKYLMKEIQQPKSQTSPAEQQYIAELSEENKDLKKQLTVLWGKINDQTRKIEEERAAFWEELEAVRGTATKEIKFQAIPQNVTPLLQPQTTTSPSAQSKNLSPLSPAFAREGAAPIRTREVNFPAATAARGPTQATVPRAVPTRGNASVEPRAVAAVPGVPTRPGIISRGTGVLGHRGQEVAPASTLRGKTINRR